MTIILIYTCLIILYYLCNSYPKRSEMILRKSLYGVGSLTLNFEGGKTMQWSQNGIVFGFFSKCILQICDNRHGRWIELNPYVRLVDNHVPRIFSFSFHLLQFMFIVSISIF